MIRFITLILVIGDHVLSAEREVYEKSIKRAGGDA